MQKVDLVIAGVGVLAVLATTLGVVFYDEAAGQQSVVFPETSVASSETGTGSGTITLEFDVADNATAFEDMTVTVQFTGTAGVNPSGGSYEVRVTAPDGSECDGGDATWSASDVTIDIPDCRWADVPATREAGSLSEVNETLTWSEPLTVEVIITNPTATNVPNVHSYGYSVRAQGNILVYAAQVEIPDPQAGQ